MSESIQQAVANLIHHLHQDRLAIREYLDHTEDANIIHRILWGVPSPHAREVLRRLEAGEHLVVHRIWTRGDDE